MRVSLNFAINMASTCVLGSIGSLAVATGVGASTPCAATELAVLQPPGLVAGDEFGVDVNIQNNAMLVATSDTQDAGSVHVYRFNPCRAAWTLETMLTASDGAPGDYFNSTAFVGNVALVGAWGDSDAGPHTGSVYVFRYGGQNWAQEQKLVAPVGHAEDYFGIWNAISGDWIAIGAVNDDAAAQDAGAVHMFHRSAGTWTHQMKVTAADAQPNHHFGYPTLMLGNVLVVGAYGDDDLGTSAGAAYVFQYNGTSWVQQQKLYASDGGALDFFGLSGAMDSQRIVLGAGGDAVAGQDSGSAYVFKYNGLAWVEEAKLVPSDGLAFAEFGGSGIAVRDDVIVIAAWLRDEPKTDAGAAYVFRRSGLAGHETWTEVAKLTASDAGEGSLFGGWLSLGEDGTLVVGSRGHDAAGRDAGSAYLFRGLRDCNQNGVLDLCDVQRGASPDLNKNGNPDECEAPFCGTDLNGDGVINGIDLGMLLGTWGTCP